MKQFLYKTLIAVIAVVLVYEFRRFTVKAKKPFFFSIIKKYFSHFIRKNKITSVFIILILSLILVMLN